MKGLTVVWIFISFLLWILCVFTTVAVRYFQYREAICERYVNCPWNSYQVHRNTESNFCVKLVDSSSSMQTFITGWELASPFKQSLADNQSTRCWTDGSTTTINNPSILLAVFSSLSGIFLLVFFYSCIVYCRERMINSSYYVKKIIDKWLVSIAMVSFITLSILLIVFAIYSTQFAKYNCIGYTMCDIKNSRDGFDCVNYMNEAGEQKLVSLYDGTWRPASFPRSCWSDTKTLVFYDPQSFLHYGSGICLYVIFICFIISKLIRVDKCSANGDNNNNEQDKKIDSQSNTKSEYSTSEINHGNSISNINNNDHNNDQNEYTSSIKNTIESEDNDFSSTKSNTNTNINSNTNSINTEKIEETIINIEISDL